MFGFFNWSLFFLICFDALKNHFGRLIVGVLGNELALEGALEDGLAEAISAFETLIYMVLRFFATEIHSQFRAIICLLFTGGKGNAEICRLIAPRLALLLSISIFWKFIMKICISEPRTQELAGTRSNGVTLKT